MQVAATALQPLVSDVGRPQLFYISTPAPSHDRLGHPECAARGTAILDALQANKLTPQALPGQVGPPIFIALHQEAKCQVHQGCAKWADTRLDISKLIPHILPVSGKRVSVVS